MTAKQIYIDWLLAHPKVWQGYDTEVADSNTLRVRRCIVEAMKVDGVISKSTYWMDCAVSGWIQAARRYRRERAAGLTVEKGNGGEG